MTGSLIRSGTACVRRRRRHAAQRRAWGPLRRHRSRGASTAQYQGASERAGIGLELTTGSEATVENSARIDSWAYVDLRQCGDLGGGDVRVSPKDERSDGIWRRSAARP